MNNAVTFVCPALAVLASAGASYTDLRTHRIANRWLLSFFLAALLARFALWGRAGVYQGLLGVVIPFLCLFPLFALRMMGAGDVKLLCVLGAIAGKKDIPGLMALSFLIGAVISAFLLLTRRNGRERFHVFIHYLYGCLKNRKISPYSENFSFGKESVHLSVPVLISAVIYLISFFYTRD